MGRELRVTTLAGFCLPQVDTVRFVIEFLLVGSQLGQLFEHACDFNAVGGGGTVELDELWVSHLETCFVIDGLHDTG